ncbi:DUF3858 domain-containing protein [Marixanthomonas sp. SCSIO 43207]|uniref:transglutaminase domain-containing protein n=1 Tax=Marixanthomonas sp. SCSIO 43207 TaxID=2779360 RepID=UPI001CA7D241|nr:transglutaminase domain-containing protein [Marixanthomonas sp. SCSIO 43207]UAB81501.1 DUF3858 domain-containing protein [Marixanthomonas sp. SCSIO 43207]
MKFLFTFLITLCTLQVGFSQDFRFGKVSKEELLEKQHPTDSTADAAILYREIKSYFEFSTNEGFYLRTDVFERIKIYNKDGFDWANKKVKLYQSSTGSDEEIKGLKGYTYFLEGDKIQDVKLRNDGIFEEEASEFLELTKFTMPNVKEGCVIEYEYSVTSPFITNIDEYRFQEQIPVNKVSMEFQAPEYFSYKTHQRGWIPFRIQTSTDYMNINLGSISSRSSWGNRGGNTGNKVRSNTTSVLENVYSVIVNDVPALKEEAFTSNIDNFTTALKFELSYTKFPNSTLEMYTTTWEDVSKSIYDSDAFGGQLKRDNYFDDEIDNLLQGVTKDSEKVIRIYEYVKAKMNWNSYKGIYTMEGSKNAYKNGVGNASDINLLLVNMLRYAGIQANPVLVSTKSNGIPLFPTRNGFDYVVAAVETKNNVTLLDATNKEGEPDILKPELLNWQGRLIREDRSSTWVSLYPKTQASQSTLLNLNIDDANYAVKGSAQNRYTGHYALSQRKNYKNIKEEDVRKSLEKRNGDAELSNINFGNLEELYKPVTLQYDFENFEALEEIGGKLYFSPLLFLALEENPFKTNTRQYPIDFSYPIKDRYIITVNIPEGYKVESKPESAKFVLNQNAGLFSYIINEAGNKIQISVDLAINQPVISADSYEDIKRFFQVMVDKENEKIVLSKV